MFTYSRIYVGFLAACILAFSSACSSDLTGSAKRSSDLTGSAKHCLVPSDFAISKGEGISPALKSWLGFYSGYWGRAQLHHTLVVADVAKDGNAVAYYAFDAYPPWNIHSPGCSRQAGVIKDNVLTLTLRNGAVVQYWFADADTLQATYDRGGGVTNGQFKRDKVKTGR